MKAREEEYTDQIEIDLALSINVSCYDCPNFQTVSIPLNDFSVDHTDWHIYGPSDRSVKWALKEVDSPFKLCSKDNRSYRNHIRYYCPDCQKKLPNLVEVGS